MYLGERMADGARPERPSNLIKPAYLGARRAVDDAVRAHGVTAAQWGVLNRLATTPGLSGADLARLLSISPQAAQAALVTLEQKGLVTRDPDATHGRIVRSSLTEEGKRVADLGQGEVAALEQRFMAGFSAAERVAFADFLRRYIANAAGGQ